jgi:PAS domain S-box-containing protein
MQQEKRRFFVPAIVLAVVGACLVGIWILSADARREIDALATANADSTQWNIAQTEVELLTLETAVLAAMHDTSQAALRDVRRRFDVFYSRIHVLQRSRQLARVREDAGVAETLGQIVVVLDRSLPLIDGPDEELRAGLDDLAEQVSDIRNDLRFVTLESVRVFAALAEQQRERVASALLDLAVLIVVLILVLSTTVFALVWSLRVGQRRTAEVALAQSRQRTIVGTSIDGVMVVGRDGRVLDCNPATERIFGYAREEVIGARMADLIIPDHLQKAHQEAMEEHLRNGRRRILGKGLVQLEAKDKSGRIFPVELSIDTAESTEGEIFVSFIRDISDRQRAERELVETRDKALAGEEAKAEFLAVMSHEMRTPLSGILGGLELLSGTDLSERQKGFVDMMGRSGQLLMHHVNSVLDISRDDAGKTVLRPELFDPVELLKDVVNSQAVEAEAKGNQLHVSTDDNLGPVIGDRTRLMQVIVNLVANAIKFTRDGQITLTAKRLPDSTDVEFRVSDTGIGIALEDQSRVFEDFVTLDTRYAREVEGTGLGLGIARRLVVAMGGEMGVVSQPGSGSEFWLRLPLPPADTVPPGQEAPAGDGPATGPVLSSSSLTVLVVEDNQINRTIAVEMLVGIGCETVEASDGAEAQKLAGQRVFDLILMDISMPRIDGISATRQIRDAAGPNRLTPIVALTAHALPKDIERFRHAGMTGVLVKPLSRKSLIDIIGKHCPGHMDAEDAGGETAISVELAQRASVEIEEHLARMESMIAQGGDLQDVASRAHLAAGLAAVTGLAALQDALVTLELAVAELEGEEGEAEALAEMLAEARDLFRRNRSAA